MTTPLEVEVCILGAGPVGATLAAALRLMGGQVIQDIATVRPAEIRFEAPMFLSTTFIL